MDLQKKIEATVIGRNLGVVSIQLRMRWFVDRDDSGTGWDDKCDCVLASDTFTIIGR
jgi:hypothetical protein